MRFKKPQVRYADTPQPATPYQAAGQVWDKRIGSPRVQAKNWRLMAFGCLTLALLMAGGLWRSAQSIVTPYVVEVDNTGQVRAVGEATPYRPNDAQTAHHIARFVTLVRSLSIDPIVVRQNWLDAYDYDRQGRGRAQRLRTGQRPVRAHRQGVGDGADHQRRARQRHVFQRALDGTPLRQRRRGGLAVDGRGVHRAPAAAHRRTPAQEPLGIYVNGLSWSRELDSSEGAKP